MDKGKGKGSGSDEAGILPKRLPKGKNRGKGKDDKKGKGKDKGKGKGKFNLTHVHPENLDPQKLRWIPVFKEFHQEERATEHSVLVTSVTGFTHSSVTESLMKVETLKLFRSTWERMSSQNGQRKTRDRQNLQKEKRNPWRVRRTSRIRLHQSWLCLLRHQRWKMAMRWSFYKRHHNYQHLAGTIFPSLVGLGKGEQLTT